MNVVGGGLPPSLMLRRTAVALAEAGQTVPTAACARVVEHIERRRLVSLIVVTATVVLAAPAHSQIRGGPTFSTDRVVSPTVVASFISHTEYSVGQFTLLVLWRGSPGWFTRGSGHSGSSGGGGGFGESRGFQRFSYGGLSFELQFDWTAASAKLLDREISLRETNLILLDNVDITSGPVLIDARRIDVPSELGNEIDAIRTFINRSPELFAYLQCDKQLPDAFMQAMIAIVCDQMRPR
jgi:hypothetical protein